MTIGKEQQLKTPTHEQVSPERIMQLGHGFWASKALLSAFELGVFSYLADGPRDAKAVGAELGLHSRSLHDFLDALVSLGMLERKADQYANTPDADLFLDRAKPSYIGGLLEVANTRLYHLWGSLTDALRSGEPQNEIAQGADDVFAGIYADPEALRQFLHAMTGVSMGAAQSMAEKFPWERYHTVIDIGCAEGCVPVQLALRHAHLTGGGLDLPPVGPIFADYVAAAGLTDRLQFFPGDFWSEDLPSADVHVMGHILHDWDLDQRLTLVRKAYEALPKGGALIVYDAIIDDDRRANTFGLLMSLLMLLETRGGSNHTFAECRSWMAEVGFRETWVASLVGPDSMVVGIK